MKKYKLALIEWVDSQIVSLTWGYVEDVPQIIASVSTVGYIISETKDIVSIASSISFKKDASTMASSIINIPKCCIKKKTVISSLNFYG